MKLTPHEQRILELVRAHPEIIEDREKRIKIAEKNRLSEKTLRNRIADLKKYGVIGQDFGHSDEIMNNDNLTNIKDKIEVSGGINPNQENEINILDYLRILLKWKKLIISNFVIVSVVAAIISLVMPKTYQSTAVLMPPVSQSGIGMLGALSNLPFGGLGIGGEAPESQTFLAILKSRTVMETVVNMLNLIEIYEADDIEEAVKNIREVVSFEIEDEGTIRITAYARTSWLSDEEEENTVRQLASNIANYFVAELDRVNKELKTEQAKFKRLFVEERYNENIKDLKKAEDRYKNFQEKNKMIALVEQTKVAIEAAATIKSQILANEVRLGVMSGTLNSDHPEVRRIKREIEELQQQLKEMDYGTKIESPNNNRLFPVFSEVPDLGIRLARLQREVKIQNTLFTFLTQQYEEAKIQEAKDTPTVQVLDKAVPSIKRSKPRRIILVLGMAIFTIFMSIIFVFVLESIETLTISWFKANS